MNRLLTRNFKLFIKYCPKNLRNPTVRKEFRTKFHCFYEKIRIKLIAPSINSISKPFDEKIYKSINEIITLFDYFLNFDEVLEDPINAKYNIAKKYYNELRIGLCFGKSLEYCINYFTDKKIPKNTHINSPNAYMIQIHQNKFAIYYDLGINILNKENYLLTCHNLNIEKRYSFEIENNFSSHELLPLIEEGIYYVAIAFKNKTGHAIVIIKEKNRSFIYDPNIGTVQNGKIRYSNVSDVDLIKLSGLIIN